MFGYERDLEDPRDREEIRLRRMREREAREWELADQDYSERIFEDDRSTGKESTFVI